MEMDTEIKTGTTETEKKESGTAKNPFLDVKESDWFYEAVLDVNERGLMTGIQPQMFGPSDELIRAQAAVVLYRMAGCPKTAYEERFPDVPEGQYYTDAVIWASKNGIITGYTGSGTFGPSDPITREQLATMLYRYAKYKGYDTEIKGAGIESYPDRRLVSLYAQEAMGWCAEKGIIAGNADTDLLIPLRKAVRAVCAVCVSRFIKAVQQ